MAEQPRWGRMLVRVQPVIEIQFCGVEQRQLAWLITKRSEVRVLPPQPSSVKATDRHRDATWACGRPWVVNCGAKHKVHGI